MRLAYVALAVLLVAAAWSVRSVYDSEPAWEPGAGDDVVEPEGGRGWVGGLDGLYGIARESASALDDSSPDLGAIGYAQGSDPPRAGATGVVHHEQALCAPGLNLLVSGDAARAELVDMQGALLHTWEVPYSSHVGLEPLEGPHQLPWRRVVLLDDGGLLAIHDGRALVRIDRDSRIVWARALRAHHDLFVHDEEIVVLTRGQRVVPEVHPTHEIVDDRVARLDLDGNVLGDFSLWDAFARSEWRGLLARLTVREGDVMHSNSLQRLDGRLADRHPAFRAGNYLIACRDLDLVAVVDPRDERFVWLSTGPAPDDPAGPWRALHHPTVTEAGTLLVFDNLGRDGHSRLVELDVVTQGVASTWAPENPADFSTQWCGVADPLPGGNVLVTETCRGRAFELSPEGEIVWEYRSPRRVGPGGRYVAALFEVQRLPSDSPGVLAIQGR